MKAPADRLLLLDWLKVLILAAIQTLHMNEFVFFEEDFPLLADSFVYRPLYYYARLFSLGGQGLVAVSYLLFGLSGKTRSWLLKIAGLALLGQLLLTFAFHHTVSFSTIEWDIYLYIFVTNLVLAFLPRGSLLLIALSLFILFVSPSHWKAWMPEGALGDLLVGRTDGPGLGWAPLPWFFLAVLFFNLGDLLRSARIDLRSWRRWEVFFWPVLFVSFLPFVGYFYWTPIGSRYYEHNFHAPAHVFWANFLPYVFVMRLAFISSVRQWLGRSPLSRFISGLKWTRNVGAVYIVAILYVGLIAQFDKDLRENPLLFDLLFLSVMPVTEMIVRGLSLLLGKISGKPPGVPASR